MAAAVDSLNTKKAMGAGTDLAGTVYTDHIVGTIRSEKGTITKPESKPKSSGGQKQSQNRRNLRTYLPEDLSQVLCCCLREYPDVLNEFGTKLDDFDYVSGD